MADINFNTLVLMSDWQGALKTLLGEAEEAIRQEDAARKLKLQDQLLTFIKRSPAMADALDVIALGAIGDLTNSVLKIAIENIQKRNEALKAATNTIEGATEKAQKEAKRNQLKTVIDTLDRAKAAVEILKNLETNLGQPDQNLIARIGTVTSAIEELLKLAKPKAEA